MKLVILCTLLLSVFAGAKTYVLALKDLEFEDRSKKLTGLLDGFKNYNRWALMWEPHMVARAPVGVHVYLAPVAENRNTGEKRGDCEIAIKVEGDKKIVAQLDIPHHKQGGMMLRSGNAIVSSFKFSFDPAKYKPADEKRFDRVVKNHYKMLSLSGYVGSPWFNEKGRGMKFMARHVARDSGGGNFSFYTGARAISDNLALDRALRLFDHKEVPDVDIATIEGVTTKAIDWKEMMPKAEVAIDPLAMLVPEDQHVLICPSLAELDKIVSLVEVEGSPLAQSFSVRNPFRLLPTRYKKQLGLNFPASFTKLVPAKSVAITGYDPFFPTGTDVAVLIESGKPKVLFDMLKAATKLSDRHIVLLGDVVVLANSEAQINRIRGVHEGRIKSLGVLDEYTFFRHRYPIRKDRTGFVFLSDACIRRWAGPKMRIAASRRTRSLGALNYLTAHELSEGKVAELDDFQTLLLGKVSKKEGILESDKMGNLNFMTPTIEMEMLKVTKAEAAAYKEWKRGYEQGWRKVFDPIGFSFYIDDMTKELDLTVMPLTMENSYEDFIKLAGKSILSDRAKMLDEGHAFSFSFAVDKDSEMMKEYSVMVGGMFGDVKANPFSWLGSSVTFFIEKEGLADFINHKGRADLETLLSAPFGLRIRQDSKIKLASFLISMKALSDKVAPGSLKWGNGKHEGVSYTSISSDIDLKDDEDMNLFYVITDDMIILTMREDVLKREIERSKRPVNVVPVKSKKSATHIHLKSGSNVLSLMSDFGGVSFLERQRKQSYRAIPILNEWKRLFNASNPVEFHMKKLGEDLFCPGGKGYVWNEGEMTMESVVFGHPAGPKEVKDSGLLSELFDVIESSMYFENDGVRVRLKLDKNKVE